MNKLTMMANLSITLVLLLMSPTVVASFSSKLHHFRQANAIQNRQHAITHKDTSTASLHSSLTVDDWHSASQLHPLDNLGGVDESSSSFMMAAGTHQYSYDGTTYGRSDGTLSTSSPHHSLTVSGDNDETREIMEAFFPVLLLIVLEIYSQKMLQFPMA
jgi:hypothetical protein